MDPLDARLVDALQRGLPIVDTPFAEVARALDLTEQAVVDRVARLLDDGTLTRFGPLFNADRMGGAFTLAAMQVPTDRLDAVATIVNEYPEVAHNYVRDHAWNMWFVLATESAADISRVLDSLRARCGYPVIDLPRCDEYYVGLHLPTAAP